MTTAKIQNVQEELKEKATELLAGVNLLRAGIDPDKNPELLQKAIGKTLQVVVKLSEVPYGFVGKTAEWLTQFKLLEFGIDSYRYPSRTRNRDLDAFVPFVETPDRVPVQVKSCSLRMHGYAIRIDDKSLNEFEGWYIAVLEREPWDDFLYITDDEMREMMKKYGEQPEKTETARRHHKDRWYLSVPRYWEILKYYVDSSGFVEEVLGTEAA